MSSGECLVASGRLGGCSDAVAERMWRLPRGCAKHGRSVRDRPQWHAGAQDTPGYRAFVAQPRDQPRIATGYRRDMTVVRTAHYAAATANPLATQVACRVLRDGGTAADAVVAAQAVLGLVEPQSSGIGGGGYLVYFDARTGSVQAYDGREVAPAAATENYLRWVSDVDRSAPRPNARASGRSIGYRASCECWRWCTTSTGAHPGATSSAPR